MKSYYAARAKEYDKIYLKPERQSDLRLIERWLPPKFAQARVLEVAAGTGYWTQFLAPVAQNLVALDASAETFEVARSRLASAGAGAASVSVTAPAPATASDPASSHSDNVQWLIGDAYDIPAPNALYDAAFAGFWFSHVPYARQREFLTGLNRVLKPGAKVVLLDNLYVLGSSTVIAELDKEGNTYQTRPLVDGSQHRLLKNFPTAAQLLDCVDGLGVDPVYTAWDYYWAFEYTVPAA